MSTTLSTFTSYHLTQPDGPESGYCLATSYTHSNGHSKICSPFPLNFVLGNLNGRFAWGFRGFSNSARKVHLDGTILTAELQKEDGTWAKDTFDLDKRFGLDNRHTDTEGEEETALKALDVPVVLYLENATAKVVTPEEPFTSNTAPELEKATATLFDGNDKVAAEDDTQVGISSLQAPAIHFDSIVTQVSQGTFEAATTIFPDFDVRVSTAEGDDAKIGYATAGASSKTSDLIDGVIAHTSTETSASASAFHVEQTKGGPIEQSKVDIFEVGAEAGYQNFDVGGLKIGKYVGAGAHVNLVKMESGPFNLNLGAGVDTNIGIKDSSLEAHVAGCGVTIGTTIGISAFGSGFSIDFKKLFG